MGTHSSATFAVTSFKRVFDTFPEQEVLSLAELVACFRRFELKPQLFAKIERECARIEQALGERDYHAPGGQIDLEHYVDWWPQVRAVASLGPDDALVLAAGDTLVLAGKRVGFASASTLKASGAATPAAAFSVANLAS